MTRTLVAVLTALSITVTACGDDPAPADLSPGSTTVETAAPCDNGDETPVAEDDRGAATATPVEGDADGDGVLSNEERSELLDRVNQGPALTGGSSDCPEELPGPESELGD